MSTAMSRVRRPLTALLALVVALAISVVGPFVAATPASAGSSTESGNFLADANHDNVVNGVGLQTPLAPAWEIGGLGGVGGVVFGDGNAYVGSRIGYATYITALRASDGSVLWGPYQVSADRDWNGVAYENGKVFVVDWYCHIVAYDAISGAKDWELPSNGQICDSPPTTSGGGLYVSTVQGQILSFNESTGHQNWAASGGGGTTSVAVSGGLAIADPTSLQVTAVRTTNGSKAWHYPGPQTGGGGRTVAIAGGRVYARPTANARIMQVLDLATGKSLTTMPSDGPPAVDAARGIVITQVQPISYQSGCGPCTLVARSISTGAVLWTFKGDGQLVVPPTVVDGTVYTASQGDNAYGLNEQTGAVVWSADLRTNTTATDEQSATQPMAFLGAGDGLLTISTGDGIVAFRSSDTSHIAPIEHSWNASYGACSEGGIVNKGTCTWPVTQTVTGRDLVHVSWNPDYGVPMTARVLDSTNNWVASATSTSGDLYLPTRSLAAGGSYRVQVVNPNQINLLFSVHFSENQPNVGTPAVASAAPVSFGALAVGSWSGRDLTITNSGGQDLTLTSVALKSGSSSAFDISFNACSGALLPPGWSCTARVRAHPTSKGSLVGSVLITTPAGQQSVPVSGSA